MSRFVVCWRHQGLFSSTPKKKSYIVQVFLQFLHLVRSQSGVGKSRGPTVHPTQFHDGLPQPLSMWPCINNTHTHTHTHTNSTVKVSCLEESKLVTQRSQTACQPVILRLKATIIIVCRTHTFVKDLARLSKANSLKAGLQYIVSVSSQPEAINFSMGIDATKRWSRIGFYSSVS